MAWRSEGLDAGATLRYRGLRAAATIGSRARKGRREPPLSFTEESPRKSLATKRARGPKQRSFQSGIGWRERHDGTLFLTTSKTPYCLVEDSIDVRVGERSRTHLQAVVDGGVQEINRIFGVGVSPQFFLTNCLVDD